jgi:Na+/proline symporter
MTWIDWAVVVLVVVASIAAGTGVVRLSSRHGAVSYFTSDRNLPWWAIAISNTATYQSGNGLFVAFILTYGLAANWLWWASWIVWMPLVAIVWAPMWRRMRIMTTAELNTLRYGGRPAAVARKIYALVCCFGFSVLLIGYITGFFAKTIAPIVQMEEWQILLIFGGTTALYTMFGGLMGVVVTEILHFIILLIGCTVFVFIAMAQQGGLSHILETIRATRPEALAPGAAGERRLGPGEFHPAVYDRDLGAARDFLRRLAHRRGGLDRAAIHGRQKRGARNRRAALQLLLGAVAEGSSADRRGIGGADALLARKSRQDNPHAQRNDRD